MSKPTNNVVNINAMKARVNSIKRIAMKRDLARKKDGMLRAKVAKIMENYSQRMHEPQRDSNRKHEIVYADPEKNLAEVQFIDPEVISPKKQGLHLAINNVGEDYELVVLNDQNQIISTAHYEQKDKHRLFTRWKEHTSKAYRKHKEHIQHQFESEQRISMISGASHSALKNSELAKGLLQVDYEEEIPMLTEEVNLPKKTGVKRK